MYLVTTTTILQVLFNQHIFTELLHVPWYEVLKPLAARLVQLVQ